MSLIDISFSGLTANNMWAPPSGKKWVIKAAYLELVTGTTTGSRSAYLVVNRGTSYSTLLQSEILANTGSFSTASSSVSAALSGTGVSQATATTTKYSDVEISHADRIGLHMTIQSGDTVNLMLLVDEVIDD